MDYEVEGLRFPTFKGMCSHFGVPDSRVRRRLGLGWSLLEALEIKPRESKSSVNQKRMPVALCLADGTEQSFPTVKSACAALGKSYYTVIHRITKSKWTVRQAFDLDPPPKRKAHNALAIEIDGKVFSSREECAEYYSLDHRLIKTRLDRGWSLKEALGIDARSAGQRALKRSGFIYLITNKISGLRYVGLTINDPLDRFAQHWYQSSRKSLKGSLHRDMYEFGRDAFNLKVLGEFPISELSGKEKHYIKRYNAITPHGYNQNSGGAGIHGVDLGIEVFGKSYASLSHVAIEHGIKPQTLGARMRQGMTIEEAIAKPFRKSPRYGAKPSSG